MSYVRPAKDRTSATAVEAWRQEYALTARKFRARVITETELRDRLVALGFTSHALRIEIADASERRMRADPAPPERTAL